MTSRRSFLKSSTLLSIAIAGGMESTLLAAEKESTDKGFCNGKHLRMDRELLDAPAKPLDTLSLKSDKRGVVQIFDGKGERYFSAAMPENGITFSVGGSLGTHFALLTDKKGKILDLLAFNVDTRTSICEPTGEFESLDRLLFATFSKSYGNGTIVKYNKKFYQYFSSWFQDHMYIMYARRYYTGNLKSGIDLYFDGQREDGMFHDNYKHPNDPHSYWKRRFDYGNFVKVPDDPTDTALFVRVPVENIAEFSMIEGTYFTWKAEADDQWMFGKLDGLIKGVDYITSDPYRWNKKYRLIRKGYAIDLWDFQNVYDSARVGGDIMRVELDKSEFGINYADNCRMAYSCKLLGEMLRRADRIADAERIEAIGKGLQERIDALSWNGEFYRHWVPEHPEVQRDFGGVDESRQVTLSNAWLLNRGLPQEKGSAIIRTYQRIRKEMPKSSPGEFYMCYPPFPKGWGNGPHAQWYYMNGGVSPIQAGALALGAFQYGFDFYGVDILRRVALLPKLTGGKLQGGYRGAMPEKPKRSFETIDLKEVVYVNFSSKKLPGVPGFLGEGVDHIDSIPRGRQLFSDIPFDIVDPAANGGKGCIVLADLDSYKKTVDVAVNKYMKSLYLLNACAKSTLPGKIEFLYEDGTSASVTVFKNMTGEWWEPVLALGKSNFDTHRIAWETISDGGTRLGLFTTGINNPQPEKKIEKLRFSIFDDNGKWIIVAATSSDSEVFFMPVHQETLPAQWGAAECYLALMEGLCGIKDIGVSFSKTRIAPRWLAAGKREASITAKYEASGGYASYRYSEDGNCFRVTFTHSGDEAEVELMLPSATLPKRVVVDGQEVKFELIERETQKYMTVRVHGFGVHTLVMTV